ncbi:hypothetical protein QYM36_020023 [Artemia franciscana]|uniref:Uncharacterized protein n=1 Tax=Artemia franciscana TaxID=6661 RepID=A0AA88H9E0_ARTSF|nr:hypothetical protein QYM36_020023 [Artemia franciscana]
MQEGEILGTEDYMGTITFTGLAIGVDTFNKAGTFLDIFRYIMAILKNGSMKYDKRMEKPTQKDWNNDDIILADNILNICFSSDFSSSWFVTTDTTSIATETTPTDKATTTFRPPGDINYQLPRHFLPILYTLRLFPIKEEEIPHIRTFLTIQDSLNKETS